MAVTLSSQQPRRAFGKFFSEEEPRAGEPLSAPQSTSHPGRRGWRPTFVLSSCLCSSEFNLSLDNWETEAHREAGTGPRRVTGSV